MNTAIPPDPRIEEDRRIALDRLKPSARDLEYGLALHAASHVIESYGFSPFSAVYGARMKALVEAGASPDEIEARHESDLRVRAATDPVERAYHLAAWEAAGSSPAPATSCAMQITIKVYDGLTPSLSAMAASLTDTRPFMAALGQELRNAHAEHFEGRGGSFWPNFAPATILSEYTATSATVTVGDRYGVILLHKIEGGWIKAKTAKNLAIPANDEARKLGSPGEWSRPGDGKLRPVFGRGNPKLDFKRAREGRALNSRGAWGSGLMMYWLKKQVYQDPDPQALPPDATVEPRLQGTGEVYLSHVMKAG